MNSPNAWNNEIQKAMSHPTKRKIIERLRGANLSFTELLNAIGNTNHGRFGYHLRTLEEFVELEPSTRKYRLTDRGRLLSACIQDFRFITSGNRECAKYVQNLRFGDHAVGFYTEENFKRKIAFPFLKAGLERGEAVVYLVSRHKLDSEKREIQRYGIDLDHLQKGAFTILSAYDWYLKRGKAQAKTIIANWLKLISEKQKARFWGIRAAGEMEVFFNYAKIKEALEYEKLLGRQLIPSLCGLCLYDTNRVDKEQYIHICNCHGHLISKDIVGKAIV